MTINDDDEGMDFRYRNHYFFFFLLITLCLNACKQRVTENATIDSDSNPLSIYDSKLGLSPDERYGILFDSVQKSGIFPDSKTFVDCVPKLSTDSLLMAYSDAHKKPDFNLQKFVNQYFILPVSVTDSYKSDMSEDPDEHIHTLWSVLSRKTDTADYGTKIPLPKYYIVQSGRSREVYYWDSYFIMLGLQADGRVDLIENMIDNFAYLIDKKGFIPNGNRTYYLSRSQPPFFACMVQLLAEMKGETVYQKYLPQLEKEYKFWMEGKLEEPENTASSKKRVIHVDRNTLNRYCDDGDKPRPEGYKEDVETATKSGQDLKTVYKHLRSGTESGWNYSSRWFADGKNIGTIHTTDIVPVDLNALLYNLEMVIMKGKILDKKLNEAANFEKKASKRREAVMRYCWNDELGMFFDFDFQRYRKKEVMSLATVYPLYFKMVTKRQADKVADAIQAHFLRPGGVVTTPNNTGQQWDAPYGWAPLQWMTIQALRNYGYNDLANDIKQRWIDLNVKVYKNTGKMLEKYNVENMALETGGGEYPAQDGFGWTNGVLQKLLKEK
jgi:alpha,alpha-trehalase